MGSTGDVAEKHENAGLSPVINQRMDAGPMRPAKHGEESLTTKVQLGSPAPIKRAYKADG